MPPGGVSVNINNVHLEIVERRARFAISKHELPNIEVAVRGLDDGLIGCVADFIHRAPGAKEERVIEESVKYPATWWEHVKERWAPAAALRRWPVRYASRDVHISIYRVCPHWDQPIGEKRHIHVSWMAEEDRLWSPSDD